MKMKSNLVLLLFLLPFLSQCQEVDSTFFEIDSVAIDSTEIILTTSGIINPNAIQKFYKKLSELQSDTASARKINIVHVGDSHIQADLMTNVTRESMQKEFGNAGRGLVFPHKLASTNGSSDIRFSSNESWNSHRIVSPVNGSNVGLSGILLSTRNTDFAIAIDAKEPDNFFHSIRIVTPENINMFQVATAKKTILLESEVPKSIVHKIKSGEALSIIADKYNISVTQLKRFNGLKSNTIRAGKILKIPTSQMQKHSVERSEFIPLGMQSDGNSHFYTSETLLDKIYLIPNPQATAFELNGLVLESNQAGVLYHNIGVNGAKFSDFNKYPMFFTQLKALQPDLVILSLGTNESFDNMASENYMVQLDLMVQNIRSQNPNAEILVATPPPSLFKRRYPNTFCAAYAKASIANAEAGDYAVWDLYSAMGGLYGVNQNARNGIIGNDKVHYTKAGYEKQGKLLFEALLAAFENFKTIKE